MLTREALESAVALTERFDAKRFSLTPMANTPLAELVGTTNRLMETGPTASDLNNPSRINVDAMINGILYVNDRQIPNLEGGTLHNRALDDIVDVCVPAVAAHINFAKTVVAPVVADLVTRTTDILSRMTPSKLLGMEVQQYAAPTPLINGSIENFVRKFEETPFIEPALIAKLPDQSVSEIAELMKTGVRALDSDIEQWMAQCGDDFFIKLWEDVFQQRVRGLNDVDPVMSFSDYIMKDKQASDYALAIFLISRKLVEAGALDGTEMSASNFENLMADYRNQCGAKLCRDLDAMDRDLKNGILVRSYTDNTVCVNPQVYRKWVEDDNGENEILFGNLLRGQPLVSVRDINESAADLKQAWERHSNIIETIESNNRFNRTKEVLQEVFESQLEEIGAEELATLGNTKVVYNKFVKALEEINQQDFTCLYTLALTLVCASRFAHTDAYSILKGIDTAMQVNEGITPREAAAISVIEYIAVWIAKQMTVQVATN